jgi:hypothetical protein
MPDDDRPRTYQSDRLGRVTIPDDDDRITGHTFQPGRPPLSPDACEWDGDGAPWPCGFTRDEHLDPGDQP